MHSSTLSPHPRPNPNPLFQPLHPTQVGLATRENFKDARSFPNPGAPSLDAKGRLLVGAAVGTREVDKERVKLLR